MNLPFYKYCVISKQHKLKFSRSNVRSKSILDLIHSDVYELLVISLEGAKYLVTFIDDFSKRCYVYSIKKNLDVFSIFK